MQELKKPVSEVDKITNYFVGCVIGFSPNIQERKEKITNCRPHVKVLFEDNKTNNFQDLFFKKLVQNIYGNNSPSKYQQAVKKNFLFKDIPSLRCQNVDRESVKKNIAKIEERFPSCFSSAQNSEKFFRDLRIKKEKKHKFFNYFETMNKQIKVDQDFVRNRLVFHLANPVDNNIADELKKEVLGQVVFKNLLRINKLEKYHDFIINSVKDDEIINANELFRLKSFELLKDFGIYDEDDRLNQQFLNAICQVYIEIETTNSLGDLQKDTHVEEGVKVKIAKTPLGHFLLSDFPRLDQSVNENSLQLGSHSETESNADDSRSLPQFSSSFSIEQRSHVNERPNIIIELSDSYEEDLSLELDSEVTDNAENVEHSDQEGNSIIIRALEELNKAEEAEKNQHPVSSQVELVILPAVPDEKSLNSENVEDFQQKQSLPATTSGATFLPKIFKPPSEPRYPRVSNLSLPTPTYNSNSPDNKVPLNDFEANILVSDHDDRNLQSMAMEVTQPDNSQISDAVPRASVNRVSVNAADVDNHQLLQETKKRKRDSVDTQDTSHNNVSPTVRALNAFQLWQNGKSNLGSAVGTRDKHESRPKKSKN